MCFPTPIVLTSLKYINTTHKTCNPLSPLLFIMVLFHICLPSLRLKIGFSKGKQFSMYTSRNVQMDEKGSTSMVYA